MGGLFTKAQVADRLLDMVRQGLARPEDVIRWDAAGQLSSSMFEQLRHELPAGLDFTRPQPQSATEMIAFAEEGPAVAITIPETEWDIL